MSVRACRLVHYCGTDGPNSADVPLVEIEARVMGCIDEGFDVRWAMRAETLYVCVQEPTGPVPEWTKVFSEEPLEDVNAMLKEAGFGNDA
jgi:hypothetical protein